MHGIANRRPLPVRAVGASSRRWLRAQPRLEVLENRITPTVTATFDILTGTLNVIDSGDDDNMISVRVNVDGTISVLENLVEVVVTGGVPNLLNTTKVEIEGDNGDETIHLDFGNGLITADIQIDAGGGDNLLTIDGQASVGDAIDIGVQGINLDGDTDIDVTIENIARLTVHGRGGDDRLNASGSVVVGDAATIDVTLFGGAGDDTMTGGAGDDELQGGGGDDMIDGSAGDDTLTGNGGNDNIQGGEGNDMIDGGADNDTIDGGSGNDMIQGGDGDDTLTGGAGDDTIDGGPGTDHLVETGDVDFVLTDSLLTGLGADQLSGIETATLTGGDGNNTIDASGFTAGPVTLSGLGGDDVLIGTKNADLLLGGDGNDRVFGRRGKDTLDGGNDDDQVFGGGGKDTVQGGDGNDTLKGGRGRDSLHGGNGDDVLAGGRHRDFMDGGDGFDIAFVQPRKDTWTNIEEVHTTRG